MTTAESDANCVISNILSNADEPYSRFRPDAPPTAYSDGWSPSVTCESTARRCGIEAGRETYVIQTVFLIRYAMASSLFAHPADDALLNGNPLARALREGGADAVREAIEGGADPNKPVCGRRPLCLAASDECIKALLEAGADPDAEAAGGPTPLCCALFRGLQGGAALLFEAGADPYGDGCAPIALAAYFDNLAALGEIDLNREVDCESACATAFSWLGGEACRRLLAAGASPEPEGCDSTLLHAAAEMDNVQAIGVLLEAGANPDAEDGTGCAPLFAAAGNAYAVKALIDGGADVGAVDFEGATPLVYNIDDADCTRILLAAGADPNARDDFGLTPLHHVARDVLPAGEGAVEPCGDPAAARLLIKYGADPNMRDNKGKTPADYAGESGNKAVARVLAQNTKRK